MRVTAIVPAAGSGRRLKAEVGKPYILLKRKPIIVHTLKRLSSSPLISEIILAVNNKYITLALELIKKFKIKKIKTVVAGGTTRAQSVYNCLRYISESSQIILIHDGVRPIIDNQLIAKMVKEAKQFKAAIAGVPVIATLKEVDSKLMVKSTLPRNRIWAAQTPQVFSKDLIIKAYNKAKSKRNKATDDAFLVEQIGHPIKMVKGAYLNIKITTKEDLILAEAILR